MNVLFNNCYGGFTYSDEALELYAAAEKLEYEKIEYSSLVIDGEHFDPSRTDETMIAILLSIGSERFSGDCSSIQVIEIEDGLEYDISEYDGMESIMTFLRVTREDLVNGLSVNQLRLVDICGDIRLPQPIYNF